MQFTHYSADPSVKMRDGDQYRGMTDYGSKPDGLWFCAAEKAEESWEGFVRTRVRAECTGFALEHIKCRYRVEFQTDKLLTVSTATEFDSFTDEYSCISAETIERTTALRGSKPPTDWPRIDWPRVAHKFDAIVIAPARKDRLGDNRKYKWYECWCVASGCVWSAEAVMLTPLLQCDTR